MPYSCLIAAHPPTVPPALVAGAILTRSEDEVKPLAPPQIRAYARIQQQGRHFNH